MGLHQKRRTYRCILVVKVPKFLYQDSWHGRDYHWVGSGGSAVASWCSKRTFFAWDHHCPDPVVCSGSALPQQVLASRCFVGPRERQCRRGTLMARFVGALAFFEPAANPQSSMYDERFANERTPSKNSAAQNSRQI